TLRKFLLQTAFLWFPLKIWEVRVRTWPTRILRGHSWGMMGKRSFTVSIVGFALLALFAVGLLPRGGTSAFALTNCSTAEDGINAAEEQMLVLINGARATAGLGALTFSPNLNRAAAWKSADSGSNGLGSGFSHDDSLGRSPSSRARDCGYSFGVGENIAFGSNGAETIFGMWMNSTGHRANILLSSYKVIGIGVHNGAWTTDFGSVVDSGSSPLPTVSTPAATATRTATSAPPATATNAPSATPTSTPTQAPTATPTRVPVNLAGISVPLSAGMNLVTYAGETQPVSGAIRSLQGYVQAVYEWDATNGRWEKYAPDVPGYVNSFSSLDRGAVYYIEVSTNVTWAY
ncbi:MAG: CAP domain-containing protein, partial [Tepidiformaceae bacterium]